MENNDALTKEELSLLQNRMMSLLRFEIVGITPDKSLFENASDDDFKRLYAFSKYHDIAHLVGDAVIKCGYALGDEIKAKFQKQSMLAVYRYQTSDEELASVSKALADANIPFVPLKGSVIRDLYPEQWMRTSCDIDILIHEEDLEKASGLLLGGGYRSHSTSAHDISLISQNGVNLELHFSLIEDGRIGKTEEILGSVWDYAEEQLSSKASVLRDEMFYFYHIAHMAKHIEDHGGCGIRPFIDLWILNNRAEYDISARDQLLSSGELKKFEKVSKELSEYWLEGKTPSELALKLERFIFSGGVYGSFKNSAVIGSGKEKSRVKYLLKRIWMPYNLLVGKYPSLKGKRVLQPAYEVRRWFTLFKKRTFERNKEVLKTSSSLSSDAKNDTSKMLSDLGLI